MKKFLLACIATLTFIVNPLDTSTDEIVEENTTVETEVKVEIELPTDCEQIVMPSKIVFERIALENNVEEIKPANRWGIELTDEEIDLLARIVFLECHTESEDGVSAVIEVIFNRMVHKKFPDTLEEVLSQSKPCVQFTTWKNRSIAKPTDKEYRMIEAALNGEKEVLSIEYVFFSKSEKKKIDPFWIGRHCFGKAR